jgi:hypothetical protein
MIYRWTHNGYHGSTDITVRGPAVLPEDGRIDVSYRTARRLNMLVCPYAAPWDPDDNCQCGESIAAPYQPDRYHGPDDTWYVIVPQGDEQRGRYPQS